MPIKNEYDESNEKHISWKLWKQRRFVLTFFVFMGHFNVYSLRVNLSVAIVAMTQDKYSVLVNGTQINMGPEFNWNNKIQGYVLSSFFYGYITTQLLGGYFATRFGGKKVFGTGVAVTSAITIVTPWLADASVYLLLAARIIMGIFEGVTYASLYALWAKWIPPLERSRITIQANAGSYTGTVFSMIFYSYLAKTLGWRYIFYFSGGMGLVWYAFWLLIVSESPENDSKITRSELLYIQMSLDKSESTEIPNRVPWMAIFTSKATWALNITLFCETWGFYTLFTLLPKYFKDIFAYDLSKSGYLSALPYLALAIMLQLTGQMADRVVLGKWLSVTQIRKLFIAVGYLAQTSFMMGAAFWSDAAGTVFCLVMAVGLGAFAITVICVNSLDIAPQYSGVVFGISNTIGTVPGIVSPIIAGYIVSTENPTVSQWQIIFYITAGLYLFGAVFFSIFASGNRQPWAIEDTEPNEETRNEKNGANK